LCPAIGRCIFSQFFPFDFGFARPCATSSLKPGIGLQEEDRMIDLTKEQLITFKEATRILPKRPNGRHLHISAIYRWATKGTRGIVLESLRLGGRSYTTIQALQRYGDRLASAGKESVSNTPRFRSRTREVQAREAAERVRQELGLHPPERTDCRAAPSLLHPIHDMHLTVQEKSAQVEATAKVDESTDGQQREARTA